MKTIIIGAGVLLLSFYGGYLYGKSCVKLQIAEKQSEVIKYVVQKRAKIQIKPNASRDELIELMRNGKL